MIALAKGKDGILLSSILPSRLGFLPYPSVQTQHCPFVFHWHRNILLRVHAGSSAGILAHVGGLYDHLCARIELEESLYALGGFWVSPSPRIRRVG